MSRGLRTLAACLSLSAGAATQAAVDAGPATATQMEFTPLPAGSHRLPQIESVADATLLDERGHPVRLSSVTNGKITQLTFFYTYCADPLGCPFVHETMT